VEILFCKDVNDGKEELMRMKKVVYRIQPDCIHLNTVSVSFRKMGSPLNQKEMERIQPFFGKRLPLISEFDRHPSSLSGKGYQRRDFKDSGKKGLFPYLTSPKAWNSTE